MESENESTRNDTPSPKTKWCANTEQRRCCSRRHRWIGLVAIVGIAASVIAFNSHSGQSGSGWGCSSWRGHGDSHGRFSAKDASRRAESMVDRLMNEVKASDEQRGKARAIVGAAANDLHGLAMQHRDKHKALAAILKEPALDRGKLETLGASATQGLDASSQRITTALADLAEILTPDQRLQLAEHLEKTHGL